jgi:hypothetical protein
MRGRWRGRGLISAGSASSNLIQRRVTESECRGTDCRLKGEGHTRAKQYPHGLIVKNKRIANR